MSQDPNIGNRPENKLASVFTGMQVYDAEGEKVGNVDFVYMGSAQEGGLRGSAPAGSIPVTGPVMTPIANTATDSGAEDMRERQFNQDQVPDEIRRRLGREGFIRVDDSRLFAADRYILPSQIEKVAGERVILNVPYRTLI